MELFLARSLSVLLALFILSSAASVSADEVLQVEDPATMAEGQDAKVAKSKSEDKESPETDDDSDDDEDAEASKDDGQEDEDAGQDEDGDEPSGDDDDDEDETITIDGYFAAQHVEIVTVHSKSWSSFKVVKAIEHGTEVKRGDVLVEFDARSIDESIADLETELAVGELSLAESKHKLELLKKTVPMRLENVERTERVATEDLKRFLTVKRDSQKRSLARRVTNAENWLAYQREELDQLEKMYEADDLTEETEEIILLRTRHDVESAEYSLERARESTEESLKISLPRQEEGLEQAVRKASLAWEEARLTLPAELEEAQHAYDARQIKHERTIARLDRLKSDRELMTIEAPISGTVYYGKPNHGKWSDPSSLANILRPGGSVKPNQTILSVVKLAPVEISAWIEEKHLPTLVEGTSGTVKPTAYPETEFAATVSSVAKVPSGSKFSATLALGEVPAGVELVPGMTCEVKFLDPDDEDDRGEESGESNEGE